MIYDALQNILQMVILVASIKKELWRIGSLQQVLFRAEWIRVHSNESSSSSVYVRLLRGSANDSAKIAVLLEEARLNMIR